MRRTIAAGIAMVMLGGACAGADDQAERSATTATGTVEAGTNSTGTVDDGTNPVGTEDSGNNSADTVEGGSWTILQYSMADNNLEEFMMVDLEELAEVGSRDDLAVVALVDRSAEESDVAMGDQGDWVGGRVLDVGTGTFSEVADLGDTNTGDPDVLAAFITQALTEHPADHYGLIISDHGASWPGLGPDDSFGDSLEIAEVQSALADGLAGAGVERLDVIGFDACLMANYETASAMAPYADRMIASQQLEPGHGWDYRSLQVLADGADVDTFGRAVIDGFAAQAAESGTEQDITLSLLDLTKMGALDDAMDNFAGALIERGSEVAPVVGQQLASTLEFGRSPDESESSHVVDLRMLVSQIGVEALDLAPFTDEVERAVNDVVVESIDSPANLGASGMTIYFPSAADYYDAGYEDAPATASWAAFLASYYASGATIEEGDQAQLDGDEPEVFFDDDGLNMQSFQDPATASNLSEAFIRYAVVADDGSLTYLGEEPAIIFDDGTVQGTYDLTELVITDGIDEAIAYVDLRFDDEAGVGTIDVPIAYYEPGQAAGGSDFQNALLSIVFDAESGDVLQETYYAIDESTGGYGELDADPEGLVVPEVLVLDADGNETWEPTSDVGLYADLPNLLYELRTLDSGTVLRMELGVVDFGGNVDIVTTEVVIP